MSEHATAIESAASSSVGSIIAKTAAGGSSLGVVQVIERKLAENPDLPWMQTPIVGTLSPGDICQLVGTAYIIGLVIVALHKKIKAAKKEEKKPEPRVSVMGGSGGGGPEEEVEKED